MFLTYILQYIFSLSKITHTCPIFVLFVASLGNVLAAVKQDMEIIRQCWCSSVWSDSLVDV